MPNGRSMDRGLIVWCRTGETRTGGSTFRLHGIWHTAVGLHLFKKFLEGMYTPLWIARGHVTITDYHRLEHQSDRLHIFSWAFWCSPSWICLERWIFLPEIYWCEKHCCNIPSWVFYKVFPFIELFSDFRFIKNIVCISVGLDLEIENFEIRLIGPAIRNGV